MDKENITIDGKEYVSKSSIKSVEKAKQKGNLPYRIVRTYSAGVFAGYVEKKVGKEVKMTEARRLWYWKGASSLSQLAEEGVKCPLECKFPIEVSQIELTNIIEVLQCTEKARLSIAGVPIWKQ